MTLVHVIMVNSDGKEQGNWYGDKTTNSEPKSEAQTEVQEGFNKAKESGTCACLTLAFQCGINVCRVLYMIISQEGEKPAMQSRGSGGIPPRKI